MDGSLPYRLILTPICCFFVFCSLWIFFTNAEPKKLWLLQSNIFSIASKKQKGSLGIYQKWFFSLWGDGMFDVFDWQPSQHGHKTEDEQIWKTCKSFSSLQFWNGQFPSHYSPCFSLINPCCRMSHRHGTLVPSFCVTWDILHRGLHMWLVRPTAARL